MNSLFVHAVDHRNKWYQLIKQCGRNLIKGASLQYKCTLKYQHDKNTVKEWGYRSTLIFCDYNLVPLKIT